jgi:ribosomal protein S19E (S16A)
MALVSWADVKELDIAEAKKACAFDVRREDMFSDENNLQSKFKMVSVKPPEDAEFIRLGEVNENRPFILYPEAVDWVNEQLSGAGSDYKLFRAEIERKTKALFHQYIFNGEIESPDGHNIAPMVILRASYQGWRPAMEIHLGTYRFICSNGAIMGAGGLESIRVNCHNWTELGKAGIADRFRNALDNLQDISKMYANLDKVQLSEKFKEVFSAKAFSIALRKKVLAALEKDGKVEITKESDRKKEPPLKAVLLDEADLKIENIVSAVQIAEDIPLWDVYNTFTNTVTMNSNHSAKFITDSQRVNRVFSKIVA